MTVNELIDRLQEHAEMGYGESEVRVSQDSNGILTDVADCYVYNGEIIIDDVEGLKTI